MSRLRLTGMILLALIAVLALLPGPVKGRLATFGAVHDCAHGAVFGVAFLLIAANSKTRSAAVAAIALLAFGAALELMQTHVYGTWLEYRDITADAAGIMLAVVSRSLWADHTPA
jgi:hypothetical protein